MVLLCCKWNVVSCLTFTLYGCAAVVSTSQKFVDVQMEHNATLSELCILYSVLSSLDFCAKQHCSFRALSRKRCRRSRARPNQLCDRWRCVKASKSSGWSVTWSTIVRRSAKCAATRARSVTVFKTSGVTRRLVLHLETRGASLFGKTCDISHQVWCSRHKFEITIREPKFTNV